MKKHLVVTIGRSFGSGGREIGKKLAEELNLAYYDKELLEEVAKQSGLSADYIRSFDEKKPQGMFFTPLPVNIVDDFSTKESKLWNLQREVIQSLAAKGPCVFIGRRADLLLRGRENTYNIFVTASMGFCVQHVSKRDGLTDKESEEKIRRMNRTRKAYYNYTGEGTWGEASNYDLCVDSSTLGIDNAVKLIKSYLQLIEQQKNC